MIKYNHIEYMECFMSKKNLDMSGFARMNNVWAKNTELRDVFLECEQDYVAQLKQKPSFRKTVVQLQKLCSADELNDLANKIMNDIEDCKVKPEDLDKYEFAMICCTVAIVDLQKIHELVKLPDFSDREK